MKKIPLTQGKFALVDDADFDRLTRWKWFFSTKGYAVRNFRKDGKMFVVGMHREILSLKKGEIGDHMNHNKLDNQRENLRKCTNRENCFNQRKSKANCSSRYKGVSYDRRNQKWRAYIQKSKKLTSLGSYHDEKEAAIAYNEAAKTMFGAYAYVNAV